MAFFENLQRVDRLVSFADKLVRWVPVLFGTAATSWGSAWATYASTTYTKFGALSLWVAALLGALSFLAGYSLWTYARLNVEKSAFARERAKQPGAIDLMQDVFTKQRINLQAFKGLFSEPVENKTFVDCELVGPAVILLAQNVSISGAHFTNCDLIRVARDRIIYNAQPLQNVTITRGRLIGVTLLVPEVGVATLDGGLPGVQWLTH